MDEGNFASMPTLVRCQSVTPPKAGSAAGAPSYKLQSGGEAVNPAGVENAISLFAAVGIVPKRS